MQSRAFLLRRLAIVFVVAANFLAGGFAADASSSEPIVPRAAIVLFGEKQPSDLSAFYTWLPKFGRDQDPDRVFTVVKSSSADAAPVIRISGQHWGGLVTKANYANYKLIVEFRWGATTWEPRKEKSRDSGILLHCQGEDGNAARDFKSPWLRGVEYQIIEGGTGDIILVNGFDRGSDRPVAPRLIASVAANGKNWAPAGKPTEFTRGRIDWEFRDLAWKDVLGFRGARDVEKSPGEWNRIEATCDGGNVSYFLNGTKVNEGRDGTFTSGRLLFQSEGAEIFFRRIELQPLTP